MTQHHIDMQAMWGSVTPFDRSFVRSLLRAGVQRTLDPSAEALC